VNINPILAILVLKNIVTLEEAEKVAEFVHDKPQSTILTDVINQVKELLPMNQQPLTGGPEQQAEELAARNRAADEAKAAEEAEAKASEESENTKADEAESAGEDRPADEDKTGDSKKPKN